MNTIKRVMVRFQRDYDRRRRIEAYVRLDTRFMVPKKGGLSLTGDGAVDPARGLLVETHRRLRDTRT